MALPFVLGLDGIARLYLIVIGVGVLLVVAAGQIWSSFSRMQAANSDRLADH